MSDEGEFWDESPESGLRIVRPEFGEEDAWREEILSSGELPLEDGSVIRLTDRERERLAHSNAEQFARLIGALDLGRRREPSHEMEMLDTPITEEDPISMPDSPIESPLHPTDIATFEGDQGSLFSEDLEDDSDAHPDRAKMQRRRRRRETTPSLFDDTES